MTVSVWCYLNDVSKYVIYLFQSYELSKGMSKGADEFTFRCGWTPARGSLPAAALSFSTSPADEIITVLP